MAGAMRMRCSRFARVPDPHKRFFSRWVVIAFRSWACRGRVGRLTFGMRSFHVGSNATQGGLVTTGRTASCATIYAGVLVILAGVLVGHHDVDALLAVGCVGVASSPHRCRRALRRGRHPSTRATRRGRSESSPGCSDEGSRGHPVGIMAAACGSSRSSAVTVPAVSDVASARCPSRARSAARARFASHRRGPSPCPRG